jgi:Tfp pilus assembly major pilin PilA
MGVIIGIVVVAIAVIAIPLQQKRTLKASIEALFQEWKRRQAGRRSSRRRW